MGCAPETPVIANILIFIIKSKIIMFYSLISKIKYDSYCGWLVEGFFTSSDFKFEGTVTPCFADKFKPSGCLYGCTKLVK